MEIDYKFKPQTQHTLRQQCCLFDLPDFKEEGAASHHRRDSDNKLHGGRASGTCCLNCRKAVCVCVLNVNRLVRHSGCPVIPSLEPHKELAVKAVFSDVLPYCDRGIM